MDRLSANIENQTEMLEKVYKFLGAKQDIDMSPSHPTSLDAKLWEGISDSYAAGKVLLDESVSEEYIRSSWDDI